MAPFDRILVPVARGPATEPALALALDLARRTGVPLCLLSVLRPIDEGEVAARVAAVAGSGAPPVAVETRVVGYGRVATAVAAAAGPGTLVCMPSHGGYGPARTLAAPSITEDVVRSVGAPVLVVGPRVPPDASLGDGRIVACLDGTPGSERALPPAQRWSVAFGLPLWLVHVGPSPIPRGDTTERGDRAAERRLDALARTLGGVDGWRVLHDRGPARGLAALAETAPVAMFVMASLGRTGWTRLLAGSVTAATVRRAPVPVLVVPRPPHE